MCLLGWVFVIRAISSAIVYKFCFFKIYDFDIYWTLAYKIDQGIPWIVMELYLCFVISHIVTLVCYGILQNYVSIRII